MNITVQRTVNLSEPILPEAFPAPIYEGESYAHTFALSAVKAAQPIPMTGSVVGYFERADKTTVRVEGHTESGLASLTLPPECYAVEGKCTLAIMLLNDSTQTVIYAAAGIVKNTIDGAVINGGNAIPTYDEIMAHLNRYLSAELSARVVETESGAEIILHDAVNGETRAFVRNGDPGEDGFTPQVTLERVDGGVKITTTNKGEPDHSQVVNDGVIPPPEEYIPIMSETTKGGAKVGDGLEVVDGALRVKQAKSEILLLDTATGKVYSIHATNGEIILAESASASGASGTLTLVDTETQSSWSIYISNGELMIKEATA